MKKPFKYLDLEEWTTRFENSPAEEQIGCINALAAHNFESTFNLQDKEFVAELIETLHSAAMNIYIDSRVRVQAGWKTIQLLEPLREEWNTMRPVMHQALMMIGSCNWRQDRSVELFLRKFITLVNPNDSPDAIGSLVNKLYGHDMLELLELNTNWIGNPTVIEWLMRSLGWPFVQESVQEMSTARREGEEVVIPESPLGPPLRSEQVVADPSTVATLKALLFHLAAAGELNQTVKDFIPKYVPDTTLG